MSVHKEAEAQLRLDRPRYYSISIGLVSMPCTFPRSHENEVVLDQSLSINKSYFCNHA